MFVNMSQFDQFKKIKLDQIQRVDGAAEDAEAFMRLVSKRGMGESISVKTRSCCSNPDSGRSRAQRSKSISKDASL
jgi:hypothetical protein